ANAGDKIWICHADTNNGNGQPNLGHDGTGGESGVGFNLIEVAQSAADNAHFKLHPADYAANATEIAAGYCGAKATFGYTAAAVTVTSEFCFATAITSVTATGAAITVGPQATEVTSQQKADADAAARSSADAALVVELAKYPNRTAVPADRVCTTTPPTSPPTTPPGSPAEVTAVETAVTAVEPATVAVPEPAKVAVPAPAKVTAPLPATIPAGDGSSTPQTSVWLLALLTVATVTLAAASVRIAATPHI
ncbi:MAG: hypothetical protein NTX29_06515, partial [Actinobacteria bacterium]|nr:hypothetical protein [Actinomycetota bacterium]